MTFQLSEPLILALVDRLRADLPAVIDEINQRPEVGINIIMPPPEAIYDYIPPPGILTSYPSIGIGEGPSKFEDDIGSSATGVFSLAIVIYEQASEQRELVWKLRRMAQAVTTVALEGRRLGNSWGVTFDSSDPGPTLVDDEENPREWMSWVGVRINARTDED